LAHDRRLRCLASVAAAAAEPGSVGAAPAVARRALA
jgi:hypothetical protein